MKTRFWSSPLHLPLLRVLTLATLFLACSHAMTAETPRARFLTAIAEVETGNNPAAIGRHGERGPYQFTHATWRMHTKAAFTKAHDPMTSKLVAEAHYLWLKNEFRRYGIEPTVYNLALAWNGGLHSVVYRRSTRASRDYAERVVNLVNVI